MLYYCVPFIIYVNKWVCLTQSSTYTNQKTTTSTHKEAKKKKKCRDAYCAHRFHSKTNNLLLPSSTKLCIIIWCATKLNVLKSMWFIKYLHTDNNICSPMLMKYLDMNEHTTFDWRLMLSLHILCKYHNQSTWMCIRSKLMLSNINPNTPNWDWIKIWCKKKNPGKLLLRKMIQIFVDLI